MGAVIADSAVNATERQYRDTVERIVGQARSGDGLERLARQRKVSRLWWCGPAWMGCGTWPASSTRSAVPNSKDGCGTRSKPCSTTEHLTTDPSTARTPGLSGRERRASGPWGCGELAHIMKHVPAGRGLQVHTPGPVVLVRWVRRQRWPESPYCYKAETVDPTPRGGRQTGRQHDSTTQPSGQSARVVLRRDGFDAPGATIRDWTPWDV